MNPAAALWGRIRREAGAARDAVRGASRRTVVTESVLTGLVLVCGLAPLPFVSEGNPVTGVVLAVWAALLVPVRRRYPLLTVVCCLPVVLGDNAWGAVAVPCLVWSSVRRAAPARRMWGVAAAGAGCAVLVAIAAPLLIGRTTAAYLVTGAVMGVLFFLLPALSGMALGRRRRLTGLLRERNSYLEQARTLTEEAARMEERTRIAGEMHDLLGHRIGLLSMHAGALQLAAERRAPDLAPQAELLHTTAGTAMEELRGILGVLRHRSGEETGERGTREDLTALVADSRGAGADAELHWRAAESAEADARTRQAVHRVTREGLTNALKHAPGAPVHVTVHDEGDTRIVAVVNGRAKAAGSPADGNRSGLVGLGERIALLGGSLDAGPRPEGGFALVARIPVRPEVPPAYATSPEPASDGAGSRPPLSTEVLTWPRLLGGGCAAVLVVLPLVASVVGLLVVAIMAR